MKRWQQCMFVGSFLLLIYSVPLLQSGAEIARGELPQFLRVFSQAPTRTNLRAYEKELEDASIVAAAMRPWVQYLQFVLLRDAGEKVLMARQGWLFYKPDVSYLVESPAPAANASPDAFHAIVDFRDQLAARDIRLMVVPAPGKPSLYGDMLTSRLRRRQVLSPTPDLIARLRGAGVEAMDLFELFGNQEPDKAYYLVRDTHWSAEAAQLAAEKIAARLKNLQWAAEGETQYSLRRVHVSRRSDIAHMIRQPGIESFFPGEDVACDQVLDVATGTPYRDDAESPVLVMGDSFLRIYQTDEPGSAGFIAHLARALRRPVASVVNDGGASTLVRQELARRAQLLRGKKIVIWEFVERDIRFGTEGWQRVPITPEPSRNP
jgi:hypothetical protein